MISDSKLKGGVLGDTAALLQIVVNKIAAVQPTVYALSLPTTLRGVIDLTVRSEGTIGVLNMELTQLQVDINRLKGKIGESIKTLKKSLH